MWANENVPSISLAFMYLCCSDINCSVVAACHRRLQLSALENQFQKYYMYFKMHFHEFRA